MGLDMYLTASANLIEDEGVAVEGLDAGGMEVSAVEYRLGKWRKANAIHGWFVENVQDDEDNCRPYEVEVEQLEQLRDLCVHALETKNPDGLPPAVGFFFGSSEVDDDYWEDLQLTADICNKALGLESGKRHYWSFIYQASW